jgi:uncharacterized protein (TIGR00730 family)
VNKKSLCVFCGSSSRVDEKYLELSKKIGSYLAKNGIRLIYGGASVGLMGAMADACLADGGEVIGIIPEGIVKLEVAHKGLTKMHIRKDMHERKAMMYELSDAFISLPGGFGTLDETFEILTWRQLDFHQKKIGLLNFDHYFDSILEFVENSLKVGFIKECDKDYLKVDTEFEPLITYLLS